MKLRYISLTLFLVLVVGISLDLYTTNHFLGSRSEAYLKNGVWYEDVIIETRILGNNPLLEFSLNIAFFYILAYGHHFLNEDPKADKKYRIGSLALLVYWAVHPYFYALYNYLFMNGVI